MDRCGSANRFCERGKAIENGVNYLDNGNLEFDRKEPEHAYEHIRETVWETLKTASKVICFGGDHSVSFPIIEAVAQAYNNLHVLHFDAHADLYDNFQDNPFSHASPFARLMEKNIVTSLTQVGVRTLNTHQREQAERFGVHVIEMKDLHTGFISTLQGPLYISLDMDVLDPAFAPGVSHHEPGGMSVRTLIQMIQSVKVPVVGADIVEYNPKRDMNDMTAMVAYKLFKELTSKMLD